MWFYLEATLQLSTFWGWQLYIFNVKVFIMVVVSLIIGDFYLRDDSEDVVMEEDNSCESLWIFESKNLTNPIETYPSLIRFRVSNFNFEEIGFVWFLVKSNMMGRVRIEPEINPTQPMGERTREN